MFDLATDRTSQTLICELYESGKLVSAICHGSAALVNVKLSNGEYLVAGQTVTGFSSAEEETYNFTDATPFALESELQRHGPNYDKADQLFGVRVIVSGKYGKSLITGQNPPGAAFIGDTILEAIWQ
jgi:putative intracellular protease/amidase